MPADDDKFDATAHKIADEIYEHIENDHVKDDFLTWFDLALLTLALVIMTLIPAAGAPATIIPNVAVKGYQVARKWKRHKQHLQGNA